MRFTPRDTGLAFEPLRAAAQYWEEVRRYYHALRERTDAAQRGRVPPRNARRPVHQPVPAGPGLGLDRRWPEICRIYAEVNRLFGDIVKVTPTSKVVGDMALFMVANNLTAERRAGKQARAGVSRIGRRVVRGPAGPAAGRFPEGAAEADAARPEAARGRPGASLPPPISTPAAERAGTTSCGREPDDREVVTYLLYPRVFDDFVAHQRKYSDTSVLPTPVFFYGMEPGEEVSVDIEPGKTLIIKFLTVGDPHPDGRRLVFFELNGQPREVLVLDRSWRREVRARPKAEPGNPPACRRADARCWSSASRSRRATKWPRAKSCSRWRR